MPTLAFNKRASFDYELLERYEAGLVLSGAEVKSIKTGHISLKGAFVSLHENELFLTNATIPRYPFSDPSKPYDPTKSRKLLVKRSQIKAFIGKIHSQGLTLVPIRVYTKKRLVKVEFALAKGKKKFDKRTDIAKKEAKRKMERTLKNS
jgi:SsrA-binding protein